MIRHPINQRRGRRMEGSAAEPAQHQYGAKRDRRIGEADAAQDHHRQQRERATGGSEGQKQFQQIAAGDSDETSREEADREEAVLCRRAVELIRGEFSERDWQAFQQVVLDGRPVAEVALDLKVTRNVVYLARSRILARLKAEFGELLEF